MKRGSKTIWAQARRDLREAADEHFRRVTDNYDESFRMESCRRLARAALRVHLLEQGRRSVRGGKK